MEKVNHVSPITPPTTPSLDSPVPAQSAPKPPNKKLQMNQKLLTGIIAVAVILLGVGTGKILASTSSSPKTAATAPETKQSENEAGISNVNESELDTAKGILKEGGIEGEGTHHIEREGGPTKTVYVASSVLNLQDFVDKEVEVWGQTISGKKAGWLMDVVKVKAQ